MSYQSVQTKDGSQTCFHPGVEEHFHNIFGAFTETQKLYIEPSQFEKRYKESNHIVVLDPFLGLGYSALMCIQQVSQLQKTLFPNARLTVISFENEPDIASQFPTLIGDEDPNNLKNFSSHFEHKIYYQTQLDLHELLQGREKKDADPIRGFLICGDARQLIQQIPNQAIDIIYHDAFSPKKQPELWTKQLFQHYKRVLKPQEGEVLTYSASSSVRNGFDEAGLNVYGLEGVRNKLGTRAAVHEKEDALILSELDQALMRCKSGICYEDNKELNLTSNQIVERRDKQMAQSTLPGSSATIRQFNS